MDDGIKGLLSPAMIVWTDYGQSPIPNRDAGRLTAAFGEARGAEILASLRLIQREFGETVERESQTGKDESDAVSQAKLTLRSDYPFLTDQAIGAFEWCWGYAHR